jgi:hypothetical protein
MTQSRVDDRAGDAPQGPTPEEWDVIQYGWQWGGRLPLPGSTAYKMLPDDRAKLAADLAEMYGVRDAINAHGPGYVRSHAIT